MYNVLAGLTNDDGDIMGYEVASDNKVITKYLMKDMITLANRGQLSNATADRNSLIVENGCPIYRYRPLLKEECIASDMMDERNRGFVKSHLKYFKATLANLGMEITGIDSGFETTKVTREYFEIARFRHKTKTELQLYIKFGMMTVWVEERNNYMINLCSGIKCLSNDKLIYNKCHLPFYTNKDTEEFIGIAKEEIIRELA